MKFEIRMRQGGKIIELTTPVKFRDKSLAVCWRVVQELCCSALVTSLLNIKVQVNINCRTNLWKRFA